MVTFYVRIPPELIQQCDDESLEQAVARVIVSQGLVLTEAPTEDADDDDAIS